MFHMRWHVWKIRSWCCWLSAELRSNASICNRSPSQSCLARPGGGWKALINTMVELLFYASTWFLHWRSCCLRMGWCMIFSPGTIHHIWWMWWSSRSITKYQTGVQPFGLSVADYTKNNTRYFCICLCGLKKMFYGRKQKMMWHKNYILDIPWPAWLWNLYRIAFVIVLAVARLLISSPLCCSSGALVTTQSTPKMKRSWKKISRNQMLSNPMPSIAMTAPIGSLM